MNAELKKMCEEAGVNAAISGWLAKEGVLTPKDLAVLAAAEAEVRTEILDPMQAGGIKFEKMIDKSAVKKLWAAFNPSNLAPFTHNLVPNPNTTNDLLRNSGNYRINCRSNYSCNCNPLHYRNNPPETISCNVMGVHGLPEFALKLIPTQPKDPPKLH